MRFSLGFLGKNGGLATMRRMFFSLLLISFFAVCLVACIIPADSATNDERIAEIQQKMLALCQKAQACGQDSACLTRIQGELEALTKEYQELITPADRGQPSDSCASSSDPCCGVERNKQHIRDTYHTEPTWIQCMPVTLELVWDVYEETHTSMVKYVLGQEYPGYLSLSYDQKDKTRLLDFNIAGPMPQKQVQNTIVSIQGAFTPGNAKTVKLRTSSNPADYAAGTRQGLNFSWARDFEAHARGGMTAPWPKKGFCEKGCLEYACAFGDTHFEGKGPDALSWDEVREGLKSGKCVKEYRIEWPEPWMPEGSEWVRKGKVQVAVHFKPSGRLEVTPADGFKSLGSNMDDAFDPPSKTYSLKNTSNSPISCKISKTAKWLDLSETSRTLPPGGTATVKVSINAAEAKGLKAGTYKDTLTFTNTTNGKGSTTRSVELEVSEEQTWQVFLTGQETDNAAGKIIRVKINDKWEDLRVGYGVRFDYKMAAEFTIKRVKGNWTYKNGKITAANVVATSTFDPDVYFVKATTCENCSQLNNLAGKSLGGEVEGSNARLFWPKANVRATVKNKLKIGYTASDESREETMKGYSDNLFESKQFFDFAMEHLLPLKNGAVKAIPRYLEGYMKLPGERQGSAGQKEDSPIYLYHRYVMKRIK